MGMFVRTLLIWCLVLAVPAQAAAAATRAFCGPNHHGSAFDQAVGTAGAAHAHHVGAHAQESVPAAKPMAMADDVSATVSAGHAPDQTCSACATCCSLGALLTSVPTVVAAGSASTVFTTVVPTVDAFATDGPDRPPRNVCV